MTIRLSIACTLIGTLFSSAAGAQDLQHWGSSDLWDVMVDPTLGNGCLMQSEFTDGSIVRIGLDANVGEGYLTAFNSNWGDIEEGKIYPISFDLDGEEYEGEATGIYLGGAPGVDTYFDDSDFLADIAARNTMVLFHDGKEVMAIDLAGTYEALEAIIKCQGEQG